MTTATLDRRPVPTTALRMSGLLQLAAGDKLTDIIPGKAYPVRLLARSPQPFWHWWWGDNVHDFASVQHKPKIALDWLHDDNQLIGYGDTFRVDPAGLWIDGALIPFTATDRAAEILTKAAAGIPYEASIQFEPGRIEELQPGATAIVNGLELRGPITIFRDWELVGCAICPHGYDPHTRTETELAKTTLCNFTKGKLMSTDNLAPETPVTPPAVETPAPAPAPESPAPQAPDAREQLRAEAAKFTEAFGDSGAKWFLEGKTFEECAAARITELAAENEKLRQRLSAPAPTGETNPATFSPTNTPSPGNPAPPANTLAGAIIRPQTATA